MKGSAGKKIRIGLAAAGFLCVTALGLSMVGAPRPEGESVPFETREAARGDLETVVSSTGTLTAVGTVEVGTQVSGTIAEVHADFNDKVRKGKILAVLDKALYETSLLEARASLAKAQAEMDQARSEYDRNEPLFEKGYLSQQEFLPIRTSLQTAQAVLDAANAGLSRAETNLSYTVIRSPIDGTVIQRSIEVGQTVAASLSAPTLFVIAQDLSRMQIETNVDESDIGQIRLGQDVRFTVQAYPEKGFSGTVDQIRLNPTTISNVVNYTVIVNASNEDGLLLPGMTATADFVVHRETGVLLVPNAALRFKPDAGILAGSGEATGERAPARTGPDGEKATLYYLDGEGKIRAARVSRGATDGVVTAIEGDGSITEGMRVITGLKTETAPRRATVLSRLFPRKGPGSRN